MLQDRPSASPGFRIILYWNQKGVSVSFFDWKMLTSKLKLRGASLAARPLERPVALRHWSGASEPFSLVQ
jgi:hypothetical protein